MTIIASTHLITDTKTLAHTTPYTAASIAKAQAAGLDITGMTMSALKALEEFNRALTLIAANTDSADPQLALIQDLQAALI